MAVFRQKSGRYRVTMFERGSGGISSKRISLGTFDTKKDAQKAQAAALRKRDDGQRIGFKRRTLNAIFDEFMTSNRDGGLAGTTVFRYEQLWRSYVAERIGRNAFKDISPLDLERFYAKLLTSGGRDRKGGLPRPLSVRSVQHVHALIRSVLQWALRFELVDRNVALIAKPPKGSRKPGQAFEEHEVDRLLETAGRYRSGHLIAFALETGLRRGEIAALKWSDIDIDRRVAMIRGSVAQIPGKTWYKSTKQDAIKGVALSDDAVAALRSQRAQQAAERLMGGAEYRDDGFVFAPPLGGRPSPGAIGNAVRRIAKRAGLELTKLHALRHTTATVLLRQGEDLVTVAAVLRHSSPSTTLAVYGHEVLGAQLAAVTRAADARRARRRRASGPAETPKTGS